MSRSTRSSATVRDARNGKVYKLTVDPLRNEGRRRFLELARGETQASIARRLGVYPSRIQHIYAGSHMPQADLLARLELVLQIPARCWGLA